MHITMVITCDVLSIPVKLGIDKLFKFGYISSNKCAGIAQLVEYKLPKLGVASSNLVARSIVILEGYLDKSRFFVHMAIILHAVQQKGISGTGICPFLFFRDVFFKYSD